MPRSTETRERRKPCFFKLLRGARGPLRVRFGFSRRTNAQIEIAYADWSRVSRLLGKEGYEIISTGEERISELPTDNVLDQPRLRIVD